MAAEKGANDVMAFCLPDFTKCTPALNDIVPNLTEAVEYFLSAKWTDTTETGDKGWVQDPCFACWNNLPLTCFSYCVPCCACAIHARTMEVAIDPEKTYESACVNMCVLSICCCFWNCYYAKRRTAWREKYGLKGSPCIDCLGQCCCGLCMICQDAEQIMKEDAGFAVPFCKGEVEAMVSEQKAAYDKAQAEKKAKAAETKTDAAEVAPPAEQTAEK